MARRSAFNPFYALLVALGVAFCITSCAYGVMALRSIRPDSGAATVSGEGLMDWLDKHGPLLMLGEVALIGLATFGAIGTDGFWTRLAERRNRPAGGAYEARNQQGEIAAGDGYGEESGRRNR